MNLDSVRCLKELSELEAMERYVGRELKRLRKQDDHGPRFLAGLEEIQSLLCSGLAKVRGGRGEPPADTSRAPKEDFCVDYEEEGDCRDQEGMVFAWSFSTSNGLTLTSL